MGEDKLIPMGAKDTFADGAFPVRHRGSPYPGLSHGVRPDGQTLARGSAVPIMQSRVTMAASFSSLQPLVPLGRMGSTM